jgi:hypothetical protein
MAGTILRGDPSQYGKGGNSDVEEFESEIS